MDEKANSVITSLLILFQHYGTTFRILCELNEIGLISFSMNHLESNESIQIFHA